jgi:hypothetical protein
MRWPRDSPLGGFFSFSPVVHCYTEDNHELHFYSTLENGFSVEPGLSIAYTLKPGASLSLSASYRTVWNLKGDLTEVKQGTSSSTSADDLGAAISMLDASLSFRLAY